MRVIFIDNGVTGSIGYYDGNNAEMMLTPTQPMQDYTKKKKNITRIDAKYLMDAIGKFAYSTDSEPVMIVIERPLINPARFSASISAARALEATLAIIESMMLPYQFSDSKDWQRGILPSSGHKGIDSSVLKKESMDIGIRLFPKLKELILKHKDADGILGAYQWYRKLNGKQN